MRVWKLDWKLLSLEFFNKQIITCFALFISDMQCTSGDCSTAQHDPIAWNQYVRSNTREFSRHHPRNSREDQQRCSCNSSDCSLPRQIYGCTSAAAVPTPHNTHFYEQPLHPFCNCTISTASSGCYDHLAHESHGGNKRLRRHHRNPQGCCKFKNNAGQVDCSEQTLASNRTSAHHLYETLGPWDESENIQQHPLNCHDQVKIYNISLPNTQVFRHQSPGKRL